MELESLLIILPFSFCMKCNCNILDIEDSIWEIAGKAKLTEHRTWETFGNSFPGKELPFLSEAPTKIYMYAQHLLLNIISKESCLKQIIPMDVFIKDLKLLLS